MKTIVVAAALLLLAGSAVLAQTGNAVTDELQVHFIDVGQGDGIFVVTPDDGDDTNTTKRGLRILIDAGDKRARDTFALRYLDRLGLHAGDTIDYVIATHPDADHIGGLFAVYGRYHVANTLYSGYVHNSATYRSFVKLAEDSSRFWCGLASEGETLGEYLPFGDELSARVLSFASQPIGRASNNSSIVLRIAYGDLSFLLMGDAQGAVEEELAARFGTALRSTVLKLGHHGSTKEGTSGADFLALVRPEYAVASAGAGNEYGHPNLATGNRLWEQQVSVLRTDCGDGAIETAGDDNIVMVTDGRRLEIRRVSVRNQP